MARGRLLRYVRAPLPTAPVRLPKFDEVSRDERQKMCKSLKLTFIDFLCVAREAALKDVPLSNLMPGCTVDVTGDGSCAYRALVLHLTGSQNEHVALRRRIQQHIFDNASDYEFYYQGKLGVSAHQARKSSQRKERRLPSTTHRTWQLRRGQVTWSWLSLPN